MSSFQEQVGLPTIEVNPIRKVPGVPREDFENNFLARESITLPFSGTQRVVDLLVVEASHPHITNHRLPGRNYFEHTMLVISKPVGDKSESAVLSWRDVVEIPDLWQAFLKKFDHLSASFEGKHVDVRERSDIFVAGLHIGSPRQKPEFAGPGNFQEKALASVDDPHAYCVGPEARKPTKIISGETPEQSAMIAKALDLAGIAARKVYTQEITRVFVEKYKASLSPVSFGEAKMFACPLLDAYKFETLQAAIEAGLELQGAVKSTWVARAGNLSEEVNLLSNLIPDWVRDKQEVLRASRQLRVPSMLVMQRLIKTGPRYHDKEVCNLVLPLPSGIGATELLGGFIIVRPGYDANQYAR